jgi:hypothetical protein
VRLQPIGEADYRYEYGEVGMVPPLTPDQELLTLASTDATLGRLGALVGEWTTESTHPALPGTVVVHGRASFEWRVDDWRVARDDHVFLERCDLQLEIGGRSEAKADVNSFTRDCPYLS